MTKSQTHTGNQAGSQTRALIVRETEQGEKRKGAFGVEILTAEAWEKQFYRNADEIDPGSSNVEIEVEYSSLNYKDALAATGHPGVVRNLPHVPGIDAAGVVVKGCTEFEPGTPVMVFHAKFGTKLSGGYCTRIRVPSGLVYPVPDTMSTREAMIYGTAGFTAAQSVEKIVLGGYRSENGPVVVTGATGGVGSIAVMMLNKLGIPVLAITGKKDKCESWLIENGAAFVEGREAIPDLSGKPLGSASFGGAIDTVGGKMLSNLLSMVRPGTTVTCCGLVAGTALETTVYPFILRGITLAGIDSANIGYEERQRIWNLIRDDYRIPDPDRIAGEISLDQLPDAIETILEGGNVGRTIVNLKS